MPKPHTMRPCHAQGKSLYSVNDKTRVDEQNEDVYYVTWCCYVVITTYPVHLDVLAQNNQRIKSNFLHAKRLVGMKDILLNLIGMFPILTIILAALSWSNMYSIATGKPIGRNAVFNLQIFVSSLQSHRVEIWKRIERHKQLQILCVDEIIENQSKCSSWIHL